MIAFNVLSGAELAEHEFFTLPCHGPRTCRAIDPHRAPDVLCAVCIDELRMHDDGDEDRRGHDDFARNFEWQGSGVFQPLPVLAIEPADYVYSRGITIRGLEIGVKP